MLQQLLEMRKALTLKFGSVNTYWYAWPYARMHGDHDDR
jgi:hypothetical protein